MIHELKTWPEPFQAVATGQKTHEVRKDDRPFEAGDVLRLREWDPSLWEHPVYGVPAARGYTGREVYVRVTYVTKAGTWGLPANRHHHTLDQDGSPLDVPIPGLCVLSIALMSGDDIRLELGVEGIRRDEKHPMCLADCSGKGCTGGCCT